MEFSVNIREIYDHIDILRREKSTADALIDRLKTMMQENAEMMLYDPVLIQRQLGTAQKVSANIQRRIKFLESSAEEFQMLRQSTNNIFTEALDLATIVSLE